jgi:hypothetical protein
LDVINNFDGEEIKIGTSLEDTELYSFFDQMLATGKMTASQV